MTKPYLVTFDAEIAIKVRASGREKAEEEAENYLACMDMVKNIHCTMSVELLSEDNDDNDKAVPGHV